MPHFKLVSYDLCPFVQRSVIVLERKGADYETVAIDTQAKPLWFTELSPAGQVPMLVVEEPEQEPTALFDSTVINEYLDEVTEGSMLPEGALERARHRSMIELSSVALEDAWRLGRAADEVEAHGHAGTLRAKLERLEREVAGPLFAGEQLCLVDAAALPLVQRVAWTDALVPELRLLVGLPKLELWLRSAESQGLLDASMSEGYARRYQQLFIDAGGWVGQRGRLRLGA